jgi:CubicO group peptidase (beta-lactamase class C family)
LPLELVDSFKSLPPNFAPGERYSYSNSGYVLLGAIIEAVSGVPWETFVREHIFAPLGMAQSSYARDEVVIPRRASGYVLTAHGYERTPRFSMTLTYAAGGLCSTVADLMLWEQALREQRLLDGAANQRMHVPLRLSDGRTEGYGLGWGLSEFRGLHIVHHAGGVPGFSSFFGRFVEDDLALIILSNLAGFDAAGLARAIAASVLELPVPRRHTRPVAPEDLQRMIGTYSDGSTTVEVAYNGKGLALQGEFTYQLFPTSATTCATSEDPDVELHFSDPGSAGFRRVKVIVPFYWVSAYRVGERQR